jgi:hypothetical protein
MYLRCRRRLREQKQDAMLDQLRSSNEGNIAKLRRQLAEEGAAAMEAAVKATEDAVREQAAAKLDQLEDDFGGRIKAVAGQLEATRDSAAKQVVTAANEQVGDCKTKPLAIGMFPLGLPLAGL